MSSVCAGLSGDFCGAVAVGFAGSVDSEDSLVFALPDAGLLEVDFVTVRGLRGFGLGVAGGGVAGAGVERRPKRR